MGLRFDKKMQCPKQRCLATRQHDLTPRKQSGCSQEGTRDDPVMDPTLPSFRHVFLTKFTNP